MHISENTSTSHLFSFLPNGSVSNSFYPIDLSNVPFGIHMVVWVRLLQSLDPTQVFTETNKIVSNKFLIIIVKNTHKILNPEVLDNKIVFDEIQLLGNRLQVYNYQP